MVDKKEQPSLKTLVYSGDLKKVEELIKSGVDVNARDNDTYGWTAFHWLINDTELKLDKKLPMIELLIKLGADVNLQDKENGDTPLHIAVRPFNGTNQIVELLVKNKADPLLKNKNDVSPLMKAANIKRGEIVLLLSPNPEITNLYSKIQLMEDYGLSLKPVDMEQNTTEKDVKEDKKEEVKADDATLKRDAAIELAQSLRKKLNKFVCKSVANKPDDDEIKLFTKKFVELLHSKDDVMKKHRAAWKPIVANIFLALTGIGLIAIALKAISARIKKDGSLNESLFFAKTKSQQKTEVIEEAVKTMSPQKK